MKKTREIFKEKFVIALIIFFMLGIILSNQVFATDFEIEFSEEYLKWQELSEKEKAETMMPQTFSVDVPENILEQYELSNIPSLPKLLTRRNVSLDEVSNVSQASRYNLAEDLNIRVENQGMTNECWAFSTIKSMETNIALTSGVTELKDFSERHMDYSLIKTFKDGQNTHSLNREVGSGGLPIMGLAYLTNGTGAVLENEMPFENNMDEIYLTELRKPVDTIVTGYRLLPTLNKVYDKDSNGNTRFVEYYDNAGNIYSDSQIEGIRNVIKQHIVKNGAIASFTAGSKSEYYNTSNVFNAENYNCNNTSVVRDHAVTIVGWDDNYSRDNFKEGKKPSTDGAYIVLNSYGEESFDSGYLYISYEDFFIESELYGITSTSSLDYDNIYQYDDFGGVLKIGASGSNTGYFGTTYDRKSSETEILNDVGITVADYAKIEIYVNPNGNSLEEKDLIKVGESGITLTPGYHRIKVTPTELTGEIFSIVIKQTAESGNKFNFQVETQVENSVYDSITSENRSYISLDGSVWSNLSTLSVPGTDMKNADVCIKAFTSENAKVDPEQPMQNEDISSDRYKITEDGYIMNITHNTTREEFLRNIQTDLDVKIINTDSSEFLNDEEIVITGMKLQLSNNKEYTMIIRGDTTCDGRITLTDFSKLLLHYHQKRGYILKGNAEKACDLNLDGKVSLVDFSQMIVLYTSI